MSNHILKEYVQTILAEETIDDVSSSAGFYYDPKKHSVKDFVQYAHKYKNFYPELPGKPRSVVSPVFFNHFTTLLKRYHVPEDVIHQVLNRLINDYRTKLENDNVKSMLINQAISKLNAAAKKALEL